VTRAKRKAGPARNGTGFEISEAWRLETAATVT
jgi:hypothetical protein